MRYLGRMLYITLLHMSLVHYTVLHELSLYIRMVISRAWCFGVNWMHVHVFFFVAANCFYGPLFFLPWRVSLIGHFRLVGYLFPVSIGYFGGKHIGLNLIVILLPCSRYRAILLYFLLLISCFYNLYRWLFILGYMAL